MKWQKACTGKSCLRESRMIKLEVMKIRKEIYSAYLRKILLNPLWQHNLKITENMLNFMSL